MTFLTDVLRHRRVGLCLRHSVRLAYLTYRIEKMIEEAIDATRVHPGPQLPHTGIDREIEPTDDELIEVLRETFGMTERQVLVRIAGVDYLQRAMALQEQGL